MTESEAIQSQFEVIREKSKTMTQAELNKVLILRRELEFEQSRLSDLRAVAAAAPVSKLDDMPRAKPKTS